MREMREQAVSAGQSSGVEAAQFPVLSCEVRYAAISNVLFDAVRSGNAILEKSLFVVDRGLRRLKNNYSLLKFRGPQV